MDFSFLQVALICFSYLAILFGIAFATEKGFISEKVVSHPITYIFSLGIFASAWSFYGVIDLANQFGYGAFAYYFGTGALFLFAPIALKPLMEIARRFQINSMADLLTFRYHSHSVGAIVTLCMLLAMAPLLALQIQAVADTIHILTHTNNVDFNSDSSFGTREILALIYCTVIALFTIAFGSNRERHKGLITVMAFESLVKLSGLLAIGIFCLFQVFGSPSGLDQWLLDNPENIIKLHSPGTNASSHTLILVFIATAVAMPHIFHITVVENPVRHATKTVSWAFPLFLMLMALPIFPILWAGIKTTGGNIHPEYFPLIVPIKSDSALFSLVAFLAGLSAATGAMIAIALAMTTMVLNHWILPAIPLRTKREIYSQLTWMRRALIVMIIIGGYGFYLFLGNHFDLTQLALPAFIATLQFLPGVIAVAHWPRGNRNGFIAGLFIGMSVWFVGLLFPMLLGLKHLSIPGLSTVLHLGVDHWSDITLWSLGLNTVTFMIVSFFTRQSDDEKYGADLCSEDELSHPIRMTLDIRSPEEIVDRLSERIGSSTARAEVNRALKQLGLNANERRPYALRRLRDEIEANLSGLMGISVASEIMDGQVPYQVPEFQGAADINLIESQLTQYRDHLTGLAAELNNLRLYHRRTLEELPLAACSVGKDMEILMWNSAIVSLTGIETETVTGSRLAEVLEPWGQLLFEFSASNKSHFYKQEIHLAGNTHWINLHKAAIPSSFAHKVDGQVILLEDVTELQLLEKELVHSERLASVGRLAAGVAHEIGNPVTGIACLAQNLKYETAEEDVLEAAEQILSQTDRVSRIVQSLVSFSHSGQQSESELQKTSLRECAQEAINLLKLQKEKQQVNFHNNLDETFFIAGDSQRLIQVFINLLSNSRDASPEGSNVNIDGTQLGHFLTIEVTDEGPGIPHDIQERVLEPFFTTKDPGEGTGLGLAMVYSIIEDHSGILEIVSPVDEVLQKGTKFVIKLPVTLESDPTSGNTMNPG